MATLSRWLQRTRLPWRRTEPGPTFPTEPRNEAPPAAAAAAAAAARLAAVSTAAPVALAPHDDFALLLTYYQRDPAYSLGLASIAAYVQREVPGLRVQLVPIFHDNPVELIAGIVRDLAPDLIAVAAMSPTWLPSDPYLRAFKEVLPETPILIGGYQAIVSPEDTIAHPAVDFVCVGDGERPTAALIRRMRGESAPAPLAGLWEKIAPDDVRRAPPVLESDLRELPFPDYSIFARSGDLSYMNPRGIQSQSLVTIPVISGRGCPYRCSYCANTALLDAHGVKSGFLRKVPPEVLVDELANLRDRYGAQYFQFWDEEFLYEARYTRELLDLYARRVGLPFAMFARVENMDDELCRRAADAGCHAMWFGVESGSERYRREMLNRRMSNATILTAAERARRFGIKRKALSMVGMPFETRADAEATLALTRAIDPELAIFSQFLPLPGTPLYDLCRRHDLLLDPAVERQMWPVGELNIREHEGGMSADEMRALGAEIMRYLEESSRFDA